MHAGVNAAGLCVQLPMNHADAFLQHAAGGAHAATGGYFWNPGLAAAGGALLMWRLTAPVGHAGWPSYFRVPRACHLMWGWNLLKLKASRVDEDADVDALIDAAELAADGVLERLGVTRPVAAALPVLASVPPPQALYDMLLKTAQRTRSRVEERHGKTTSYTPPAWFDGASAAPSVFGLVTVLACNYGVRWGGAPARARARTRERRAWARPFLTPSHTRTPNRFTATTSSTQTTSSGGWAVPSLAAPLRSRATWCPRSSRSRARRRSRAATCTVPPR